MPPPPPPPIRDAVVRRVLRLLDAYSARMARHASEQWLRCFDAQWPGGVRIERCYNATFVDASQFSRMHTLELYNCPGLTDVSSLGAVHTLTLHHCPRVTDVSSLGVVHTLTLHYCPGVTNVSSLGAVHTLMLWDCPNITDISALTALHMLRIFHCPAITPAQIAALRSRGVNVKTCSI